LSLKRKWQRAKRPVEDKSLVGRQIPMEHKSPERVALVAIGGSRYTFTDHTIASCYQNVGFHWDEVWTVNGGFRVFNHDKLFAMDDLRVGAQRYPEYGELLKVHDKPIITSVAYPEFPTSVSYPIKEIVDFVGSTTLLNNTAVYAMAYACWTGVKTLYLYGCDFSYESLQLHETGSQAAAYLAGLCKGMGMSTIIPSTSNLLRMGEVQKIEGSPQRPLYGYLKHPLIRDETIALDIQKDQECRQDRPAVDTRIKPKEIEPKEKLSA